MVVSTNKMGNASTEGHKSKKRKGKKGDKDEMLGPIYHKKERRNALTPERRRKYTVHSNSGERFILLTCRSLERPILLPEIIKLSTP